MAEELLSSLHVFRGITIAGMTLVNNPGSWSYIYPPHCHAEWHDWTATDLVFQKMSRTTGKLNFCRWDLLRAGQKTAKAAEMVKKRQKSS